MRVPKKLLALVALLVGGVTAAEWGSSMRSTTRIGTLLGRANKVASSSGAVCDSLILQGDDLRLTTRLDGGVSKWFVEAAGPNTVPTVSTTFSNEGPSDPGVVCRNTNYATDNAGEVIPCPTGLTTSSNVTLTFWTQPGYSFLSNTSSGDGGVKRWSFWVKCAVGETNCFGYPAGGGNKEIAVLDALGDNNYPRCVPPAAGWIVDANANVWRYCEGQVRFYPGWNATAMGFGNLSLPNPQYARGTMLITGAALWDGDGGIPDGGLYDRSGRTCVRPHN